MVNRTKRAARKAMTVAMTVAATSAAAAAAACENEQWAQTKASSLSWV